VRVDLDELVRDTLEDHRSEFEHAEVQPELLRAPGPVWVMADRSRLAQIIGNLLENTAKFTGRGGLAMISVSKDRAARRAVLRVADTGVGMSPELLEHLFEPLVQAEQALDRSRGGLGLGLVLVKGLVELHGGEIHARSPGPGQGSEFEVRLPLAPVAESEREVEPPKPKAAQARVLIIEDNADAANTLREVLEMLGHEVSVAYDGNAGVAKARACSPDVILSDIGLPGLDGYQVARTLRADPAFAGVRMIAVSGYALPTDVSQSLEAGFDEHIAKPIDLGRLKAVLDGANV
jgi:CheY-like chemotaxis protein